MPDVPADPNENQSADPEAATGRSRTRSAQIAVATTLGVSLLLVGVLSALPALPGPPPGSVSPTNSSVPVVTLSPSPKPSAKAASVTAGDVGDPVSFAGTSGSGEVTVLSATWTDAGQTSPPPGQRHLVVDLRIACTQGKLPTDPIFISASIGEVPVLPGFGPSLDRPLGGRVLLAGEQVEGQVGYVLPPGAVELKVLDERLRSLATIRLPAP